VIPTNHLVWLAMRIICPVGQMEETEFLLKKSWKVATRKTDKMEGLH